MPRAVDPFLFGQQLPITHSPLNRIDYRNREPDFNIDALFDQMMRLVTDYIIPVIESITGIDLSILLPILDLLNFDFSSPAAFIMSLIDSIMMLPGVFFQLIQGFIDELMNLPETFAALIGGIVELIVQLPQMIIDLLAGLLVQLANLTGIDLTIFLPLLDLLNIDLSSPGAFLSSLMTAIMSIPAILVDIMGGVIQELADLTGIDLTIFLPILDILNFDFTNPAAFLSSLITAVMSIPEVFIDLINGFVTTIGDLPNTMTDLLDKLIQQLGLIPEILQSLLSQLIFMLSDITGVDLTIFLPLLDLLNFDFSSPEALVASITTAIMSLPDVFMDFINGLITLLGTDPLAMEDMLNGLIETLVSIPTLLVDLLTGLIDLLVSTPDILMSLTTSLIQLAMDTPEILTSLLDSLVTLLSSVPTIVTTLVTTVVDGILENIGVDLHNIPIIGDIVEAITGIAGGNLGDLTNWVADIPILGDIVRAITGTTDLSDIGLDFLGGWFGDLTGILGSPLGLGSGSVSLGSVGNIPIFGPLLDMFMGFIDPLVSGTFAGDPLAYFFNVLDDIFGLLGNPTNLGTGSPGLAALAGIPILGPAVGFIQQVIDTIIKAISGIPVIGAPISSLLSQMTGLTNTSNTGHGLAVDATGNINSLLFNLLHTPQSVVGEISNVVVDSINGTIGTLLDGLFAGLAPRNTAAGGAGGTGGTSGPPGTAQAGQGGNIRPPATNASAGRVYNTAQQFSYTNTQLATATQQIGSQLNTAARTFLSPFFGLWG
jgi:hypothetical protein